MQVLYGERIVPVIVNDMRKIIYTTLLLALFCKSSFANILEEANNLINEKKNQEAIELLESQNFNSLATQDKMESYFLIGVAHNNLKDSHNTINAFKKAIEIQNAPRIQFELAALYYKQAKKNEEYKSLGKSENLFRSLESQDDLPIHTQNAVTRYQQQIEAIKTHGYPKNWHINASAGYMHDSNANAGTTENTVLMFNLPFVLSEDAKETSDDAYKYNFGLNYAKMIGSNWQAFGNIGVAKTDYQTLNNFDLVSLYSSGGIKYKRNNIIYSLPIALNRLTVGHKNSYYNYTYGLNPSITVEVGKNMEFNNQFVLQKRKYRTINTRNGHNITYRPSFKYYFNPTRNHFLGINGNIGTDSAKDDINSNKAYGFGLAYYKLFFDRVSLYFAPYASKTEYKKKENAFDEIREDKMYSLTTSVTYQFKGKRGFKPSLSLNHSFTKNDSNLSLYSYERQQVGVDLSLRY